MSKNLIPTEPGGEQTQYEATHTFVEPHAKQTGQFGDASQTTKLADQQSSRAPDAPNTQGITPADKIRYGQSIQEGGVGGKTNAGGEARVDGGFGGARDVHGDEGTEKSRREQGYGVGSEGDDVGA